MDKKNILEVNIERAKILGVTQSLEDEFLLIDNLRDAPIPNEPRRINFIVIGICLQGKVSYTIDTQERIINKNDIIVISDRHVIDNYQSTPDTKGLCMIISNNFFNEIIRNVSDVSTLFLFSRNNPVVNATTKEVHTFINYFNVIKRKMSESDNHYRRDLVRTLTMAMFYDMSNVIYRVQHVTDTRQTRADAIFTKFIRLVEENFKRERRVGWYAEQICITPKYLSETVKQVSKRTPNEWIDSFVTLEVRVLLKNSAKSIKEIAMDLNFPNQSFLGKYFKEHVGISPSKYRKT